MKNLIILLSLVAFAVNAQNYPSKYLKTDKELDAFIAMRKLHDWNVPRYSDSTLMSVAAKIGAEFTKETSLTDIEEKLNYETPKQEYEVFITQSDFDYKSHEMIISLDSHYPEFNNRVQYKKEAGVYAGERVFIILFYKKRNVLTILN